MLNTFCSDLLKYMLKHILLHLIQMQLPTNFALNEMPFIVVMVLCSFTYSTTCSQAVLPSKCLKFSLIFMAFARIGCDFGCEISKYGAKEKGNFESCLGSSR